MSACGRCWGGLVLWVLAACGGDAQQASPGVVSSDPELAEMATSLLPDLARRAGLDLTRPVRIERRSRAHLERYLRHKLDQDLPEEEARLSVAAYALLGLVPDTLDLRALLLGLYAEQVAGFYEPDSTALFILDDQPASVIQPLLVHELVHAVQDQRVDLAALTDPSVGNDRGRAALAAIEGHATLVMLEYLTEGLRGGPVDFSRGEDFASALRPALEGMVGQFPALAAAPQVVRESLLFPYVEGAGYVQGVWSERGREAPFGDLLPLSTEQVLARDRRDGPASVTLAVEGAEVRHQDDLGQLELGVFLETHGGRESRGLAEGWGGDRYALLQLPDGSRGLVWAVAWDRAEARDAFRDWFRGVAHLLPEPGRVEDVAGAARPAVLVRVGVGPEVRIDVSVTP